MAHDAGGFLCAEAKSRPLLITSRLGHKTIDQRVQRYFRQRRDAQVDMGKIMMCGGLVGRGDDPQIGAFRGERSRVRILERDRLVSTKAKAIQREPIEIRLWLGRMRVLATRDELKPLE